MNSLLAVIFAAFIIAVQGSFIRVARQTTGWEAPLPTIINIDLEADAFAGGVGSGLSADASQETLADAIGTVENPAVIDLVAGTIAGTEQELDINQLGDANIPSLSSSSNNQVFAENVGVSADNLLAIVTGGQSATLTNNGAANVDVASGYAAISTNAASSNVHSG